MLVHSELVGKSSENFLRPAGQFAPPSTLYPPPPAEILFFTGHQDSGNLCTSTSPLKFSSRNMHGSLPPPAAAQLAFCEFPMTSCQLPHSFTQGLFAVLGIEPRVSGILSQGSAPELYPQLCAHVRTHAPEARGHAFPRPPCFFPHRVSHCFA